MGRVQEAWDAIHHWLDTNQPEIRKQVKEPASIKEIRELEKRIGHSPPKEFEESYLIHNGSKRDSSVFIGLPLMTLDQIARDWDCWSQIADDEELNSELSELGSSSPKGVVKELYANRGWVSFVGWNGNNIGFDFDPGPRGIVGQIINCGRDEDHHRVIANSFGEFLTFVAQQFVEEKVGEHPDYPNH